MNYPWAWEGECKAEKHGIFLTEEFSSQMKQSCYILIFFTQHAFEIPGSFSRRWIKELRKAATENITAEQQARQPRT